MADFIQFIGTQRSGSNLLRLMLNQHPDVSAHHPPHLLHTFIPLLDRYGSLSNSLVKERLVRDMIAWVDKNPVSWDPIQMDVEQLVSNSEDIVDIFCGIYHAKMVADQASIWCCKSTFNVQYVDLIERKYKPFYIYLYRDGRDVAASFQKAIVGPKHIYAIAQKWHAEQQEAMNVLSNLAEERYCKVSYENLIHEPETMLRQICDKVGLIYDQQMLEYYRSEESKRTADSGDMWKNVTKPILSNNQNKFFKALSKEEIGIFEKIAGDSLSSLGYKTYSTETCVIDDEKALKYLQEDQRLRELARSKADSHDVLLRQPQEALLNNILARHIVVSE